MTFRRYADEAQVGWDRRDRDRRDRDRVGTGARAAWDAVLGLSAARPGLGVRASRGLARPGADARVHFVELRQRLVGRQQWTPGHQPVVSVLEARLARGQRR